MRAGELRDRISILVATLAPDGQGGKIKTWLDLVTGTTSQTRLPAAVEALSGSERLAAAAVTAVSTYQIRLRYRVDITPLMRVLWTPYRATVTKTLEISDVNNGDGRRFIVLACSEVQS